MTQPSRIVDLNLDDIDLSESTLRQVNTSDPALVDMLLDVKARGFDHHILCRQQNGGPIYLVDGRHRMYCAEQLGLKTIKAEIRDISREEASVLMVVMNQHRIPTSARDLSFHFAKEVSEGKTIAKLCREYNMCRTTVTNILGLNALSKEVLDYLTENNANTTNIFRLGQYVNSGRALTDILVTRCVSENVANFATTLHKARKGLAITFAREDKPLPRTMITIMNEVRERKKAKELYKTQEEIEAFSEGVKWACRLDDKSIKEREKGAKKPPPYSSLRQGRIEGTDFEH